MATRPTPTVADMLRTFQDSRGHFGECPHRIWRDGYDRLRGHRPGIDCPSTYPCGGKDSDYPGSGAPCSKRCSEARAALARWDAEAPRQLELLRAERSA